MVWLPLPGQPKAEGSSAQAGFDFVDQAHSNIVLKVGAQYDANGNLVSNGILDTEDRNANGILDLEDPNRIVTLPHTSGGDPAIAPGTDWTTYTFQLTDADRQALAAARGVRIIVKEANAVAGPASGLIVIDTISVEGTPFWPTASAADRPNVSVRQIAEYLSANDPGAGARFESAFPATYKLFHPNGEQNEVLETAWGIGGAAMSADFSVKGFVPQGTGGIQYQTIVSYVPDPDNGGDVYLHARGSHGDADPVASTPPSTDGLA